MRTTLAPTRLLVSASPQYRVRLARTTAEIQAALMLRFEVFNLELKEGLPQSYQTGMDQDRFDAVCDHLIVEHVPSQHVIGTYRLQTGATAARGLGYYSAQEFDFSAYAGLRPELVELGRACVHRQHRNMIVLGLLWKGIAQYSIERGARYLIGCSSINSQDAAVGASVYAALCRRNLVEAPYRTRPLPSFECPLMKLCSEPQSPPKLLRAYLALGASICGPPALDRQFKTIDFLTFLDLHRLAGTAKRRFLN